MNDLLIYLVSKLLGYGDVEKCDYKIACEDAFVIYIEHWSFVFTRSEVMQLKSEFEKRIAYMTDDECKKWKKLFNLL